MQSGDRAFNAFGAPVVDPASLPLPDRLDVLRRLIGRLQADQAQDTRWLARGVSKLLNQGGSLERHLEL